MEKLEMTCFTIISNVGAAKSTYMEALYLAKEEKFDEAIAKIEEGTVIFIEGHKAHMELVQKEASGEQVQFGLLLMHAEDQLMSTEVIKLMVLELIDVYRKINLKQL